MNKLNPEETHIIVNKGTERPFTGRYNDFYESGLYICKRCNAPLYTSESKFSSRCGWPSFDDEITDAIRHETDADGRRTEILCALCDGHLGHVFEGEGLTEKNVRHCVNSLSMNFVSADDADSLGKTLNKAYFAGGCFWGVEHLLQQQAGVLHVVSGYMGGHTKNPSYQEVCAKKSGHLEVVEVTYDNTKLSFETLVKLFFEIHDPGQENGQGPDIGPQYGSAIFYNNAAEKETSEQLIETLRAKGHKVVTELTEAPEFWPAEEFHQDYYDKTGKQPYCHSYTPKF